MLSIPHTSFAAILTFLWFVFWLQPIQADVNPVPVTTVSAASYENAAVTPGSVVAAFGTKLATTTTNATDIDLNTPAIDLPTNLSGTTVQVNGQLAGLLFVSPQQVNFLIPAGAAQGTATIKITSGDGTESNGTVALAVVQPAIFTFNSDGAGVLAAEVVRVNATGAQTRESLVQRDPVTNRFVTKPLDLGSAGERIFLEIYLTGIRGAADNNADGNLNENVWVLVGGQALTPTFAGRQAFFAGLDQVNVELPRSLIGSGKINLAIHARTSSAFASRRTAGFTSRLVELEIASPLGPSAPVIADFSAAMATAGQFITINGNRFAATVTDNVVKIGGIQAGVVSATNSQLTVQVPFGAMSGTLTVKTTQGETMSAEKLSIRTTVSGVVETSGNTNTFPTAPLRDMTVRVSGTNISALTNQDGVFTLLNVPEGPATIEVDPTTSAAAWAFAASSAPMMVIAGRDNLLPNSFWLSGPNGTMTAVNPTGGHVTAGVILARDGLTPMSNVHVRLLQNGTHLATGLLTDGSGGFIFRNIPSDSPGDAVVASYLRPDGTVAKAFGGIAYSAMLGVGNYPAVGNISFKDTPTNRPPLLLTPKTLTMNANETRDVAIFVDDPDANENLQIAASGPPGIAIIPGLRGAYAIRLTPKSGGTSTVKITVTDSQGVQAAQAIPLTVLAQNSTPTVTVPSARTIGVGQTLTFNVAATDPDAGQTITLVAMNMPQGASFIPTSPVGALTGTFSWTPAANQVGMYTVTFMATDNANPPLTDTKTVALTVSQ